MSNGSERAAIVVTNRGANTRACTKRRPETDCAQSRYVMPILQRRMIHRTASPYANPISANRKWMRLRSWAFLYRSGESVYEVILPGFAAVVSTGAWFTMKVSWSERASAACKNAPKHDNANSDVAATLRTI